ncbi:acyl-CoA dehydrogenase family protein [Nocardia concava]|uniref:acyl-CoA dehydrogenase family protein n=1 Tax=Nocardia concava TaxID=257281 RepID=UPI000308AF05|nr:acyl-CoA dehydrogenase family protein [Nocardia concava]
MNEYEFGTAARDLYDTVTEVAAGWPLPPAGSDVARHEHFAAQWATAAALGWTAILDEEPITSAAGVELLDAAAAAVSALARSGVKLPVRQTLTARYAVTGEIDPTEIAVLDGGIGVWQPVAHRVVTPAGSITEHIPTPPDHLDIAGRPVSAPDSRPVAADREDVAMVSKYLLLHEISGAIDGAVDAATGYVTHRVQFGRPLSTLPAVRITLGELSVAQGQIHAILREAARRLRASGDSSARARFALSAAGVLCAEIAGRVADTAHQLHGALGITAEAGLHHRTTLLWADRDEDAETPEREEDTPRIGEPELWDLTTPTA